MNFGKLAKRNHELEKEFHSLFVNVRIILTRVEEVIALKRKYLALIYSMAPIFLFLFANLIFLVSETNTSSTLTGTNWVILNILSMITILAIMGGLVISFNKYPSFKTISCILDRINKDIDAINNDGVDLEKKKVIEIALNVYLDYANNAVRLM